MSNKSRLMETRKGTVINETSKKQEKKLETCVYSVLDKIREKYPDYEFYFKKRINNTEIIDKLVSFGIDRNELEVPKDTSFITPDGGFLFMKINGEDHVILISEAKNQGTNDKRMQSGLKKQAKGNAIERSSKNVMACQTYMMNENVFPYVIFAYGCDFSKDSSIVDRLLPNVCFHKLNAINLYNKNVCGRSVQTASVYVRVEEYTNDEMIDILMQIADETVQYYIRKYVN